MYPIPMIHLLSILTQYLGNHFAAKLKTRLATFRDVQLTIYELQAIAEETQLSSRLTRQPLLPIPPRPQLLPSQNLRNPPRAPLSKIGKIPPISPKANKIKVPPTKPAKQKLAAISTNTRPRLSCFICDDPNHFCYKCPHRHLSGCCICGEDHSWQDCELVIGKLPTKQIAAISLELPPDESDLEEVIQVEQDDLHEENNTIFQPEVASLAIASPTWQTHIPLVALNLNTPIRHECEDEATKQGRLVYRCKVASHSALCLFDSGANCSLMSQQWAFKHNIPLVPVHSQITTALHQSSNVKYLTEYIPITLGDITTRWRFFVIPDLSHDIILGTDFSLWNRVTYDPFDWSLIILGNLKESAYFPSYLSRPITAHIDNAPTEQVTTTTSVWPLLNSTSPIDSSLQTLLDQLPLLQPYKELFQPKLGSAPSRIIQLEILLKEGARPQKINPYPLGQEKKEVLDKQITELIDTQAIETSTSPWAAPLLFVKKKDNSWRMCIDYRSLNASTKADAYPLPRMATLLQKIGSARYFTKIDLASGFHQIPVNPNSREFTAFSTPYPIAGNSHFQWRVMPFGPLRQMHQQPFNDLWTMCFRISHNASSILMIF